MPKTLPLAVVLLCAVPALAVEVRGQARVWAGPGLDTNAPRDITTAGVGAKPDLFAFALGSLEGQLLGESRRAMGAYDVGARKFVLWPSEDTIVQSAQLEGTQDLTRAVSLGLSGRVRDRRGAERDYTDLGLDALLDFVPDARLETRLRVGAHRFLFYDPFPYSFFGPDFALSAKYRFTRRHSVSLFANASPRTYNASATWCEDLNDPDDPTLTTSGALSGCPGAPPSGARPTRTDFFIHTGVQYSYRGTWQLSAGYSYLDQASNSFGETLRRHRLSAMLGFRLPARFMVLATGTLQFTTFPDGVYLSPVMQLLEDDENSSSVTLKVLRPLSEHVDLDLRYALYTSVLPCARTSPTESCNNFYYFRQVATLGVSVAY